MIKKFSLEVFKINGNDGPLDTRLIVLLISPNLIQNNT